jgi:hypothetical protein
MNMYEHVKMDDTQWRRSAMYTEMMKTLSLQRAWAWWTVYVRPENRHDTCDFRDTQHLGSTHCRKMARLDVMSSD